MINPLADFLAFRRDIVAHSRILAAWGFLLNVPVLVGGLIFVGTLVGAAVAAAIVISLLIVSQMHKRWPMSRLLGLSHIAFLPVLPLQYVEVGNISTLGGFEVWLIYSLVLMSASVLIDVFDLIRYASGRSSTYIDQDHK